MMTSIDDIIPGRGMPSAVRDLLKAFASLAAAVVTIDAMHTQSDTAQVILGRGADYVMTVKGNMPTLYRQLKKLPRAAVPAVSAVSTAHGRRARRPPRVLVAQGKIQRRELTRAGLTDADVHALLRQRGVDDLGRVGYLLCETRGATTLVSADREPGPLTRDVLSSAGFDHAIDKLSMITEDLCTYTMIILRQDKTLRDHGAAAVLGPLPARGYLSRRA
jgi:hypothetical protein